MDEGLEEVEEEEDEDKSGKKGDDDAVEDGEGEVAAADDATDATEIRPNDSDCEAMKAPTALSGEKGNRAAAPASSSSLSASSSSSKAGHKTKLLAKPEPQAKPAPQAKQVPQKRNRGEDAPQPLPMSSGRGRMQRSCFTCRTTTTSLWWAFSKGGDLVPHSANSAPLANVFCDECKLHG